MVMGQPRREAMALLPDKTWAHSSVHKAKLLTLVVVKETEVFIAGHQARNPGQLLLKRPEGFQGKSLKTGWGRRVVGCVISLWIVFWPVGGEVVGSQHHQPGSNQSGVNMLVGSVQLNPSTGGRFNICKTAQRAWLRILSIAFQEEPEVLDFV